MTLVRCRSAETLKRFIWSFFLVTYLRFSDFRVFNPWIPEEYPKGFCDGFQYANVSLAHFALTEIVSSAPTRTHCCLITRYENEIVRCCRRAHELCIHSRILDILVSEPWERGCLAHVHCESINTRCRFVICVLYRYVLQVSRSWAMGWFKFLVTRQRKNVTDKSRV